MDDLKYRRRFSTSVDKGIHKAFYNYSIETGMQMSKMTDEAFEDYLKKHGVPYERQEAYNRKKIL